MAGPEDARGKRRGRIGISIPKRWERQCLTPGNTEEGVNPKGIWPRVSPNCF